MQTELFEGIDTVASLHARLRQWGEEAPRSPPARSIPDRKLLLARTQRRCHLCAVRLSEDSVDVDWYPRDGFLAAHRGCIAVREGLSSRAIIAATVLGVFAKDQLRDHGGHLWRQPLAEGFLSVHGGELDRFLTLARMPAERLEDAGRSVDSLVYFIRDMWVEEREAPKFEFLKGDPPAYHHGETWQAYKKRFQVEYDRIRASKRPTRVSLPGADVVGGRSGGSCAHCYGLIDNGGAHVDHILPVVVGGDSALTNLRLLHRICNKESGSIVGAEIPLSCLLGRWVLRELKSPVLHEWSQLFLVGLFQGELKRRRRQNARA